MKERPIIFSGEMVRAILDGRKTMTRRVVKDILVPEQWNVQQIKDAFRCPYGFYGSKLYVRENIVCHPEEIYYQADRTHLTEEQANNEFFACYNFQGEGGTVPSIHMPRWASRLTLEIVSVKVERLQEITEEDIRAEGLDVFSAMYYDDEGNKDFNLEEYKYHFECLWNSINGKKYPWASNPWVWCIEFRRL